MKITLLRSLTLLLLMALLLPTLPACSFGNQESNRLMKMDEESRAHALYENMANSLLTATAFCVKTVNTFNGRLDGESLLITHTVDRVSRSQNGAARMDYYESAHFSRLGDRIVESKHVSGYANGYIYKSHTVGGYVTKAKTAIPYNEYNYMRLSDEVLLYPERWDCESVTCTRERDGSFTATFTGLDIVGLEELVSLEHGVDLSIIGDSIYLTDATVVMHSTPDLRFDSITYHLTYSEFNAEGYLADRTFNVTTEQTYEYAIPEDFKEVDLSTYEDIGDLTVVDDYRMFFRDRVYAERGSYDYISRETVTEDGEASVWCYDVEMEMGTGKGGLIYSSKGSYGYEGKLTRTQNAYEDGIMEFRETDPDGETYKESYEYTEEDVRGIIDAELAVWDFSPDYVTRIEELDASAGKYRIHLGAALNNEYQSYFMEKNGSLRYLKAYLDVTFGEEKLEEFSFYLLAEGYTDTAKNHKYEMKVSCRFADKSSSSAPV